MVVEANCFNKRTWDVSCRWKLYVFLVSFVFFLVFFVVAFFHHNEH
jgi:hypothetical protein